MNIIIIIILSTFIEIMKIVCISIGDMGHFIPIMHIAEELASRGHDVTVLSNESGKEKCEKMIT
jgi:UDP:flavonoid glycosyltransferase YjiC (YdhE family)